ncbi:hypothetical protein HYT26_00860 [Candidatus Pacearchaeota archaeon]|nr:hypothetical protein [Candidatus Pacearchaeota archaeon]
MSTKKKSHKKEHYVEDLKKRFDDILKECPKPPSFGRIINLAIKNNLVKITKDGKEVKRYKDIL